MAAQTLQNGRRIGSSRRRDRAVASISAFGTHQLLRHQPSRLALVLLLRVQRDSYPMIRRLLDADCVEVSILECFTRALTSDSQVSAA